MEATWLLFDLGDKRAREQKTASLIQSTCGANNGTRKIASVFVNIGFHRLVAVESSEIGEMEKKDFQK